MSYNIKNFDDALEIYEANKTDGICDKDVNLSFELALELVDKMTYREKATMLGGHWNPVLDFFKTLRYYNALPIKGCGCKRLKIPPIMFSDGPRGVVVGKSTCYPTANVRAASFDRELEYKIGCAIAEEMIAYGANYFAGICINLLRHPAWGRAQESYGEDQYLLGQMGVQLTKAVQKYGIIACPKHYALNSMENLRFKIDVNISEEALRDVYLPHFKDCIDAGALSIMGAYNKVRGEYCCENEYLLKKILRDEWNFKGFSTADFIWGVHDGERSLVNGMDVEMPMTIHRIPLASKLKKDASLNNCAIESCKLIIASLLRQQALYRSYSYDKTAILSKDHILLARKAEEEGAVLLKNNGVLPIKDASSKIAVVGRYSLKANIGDKGSSRVYPPYVVSLGEAVKNNFNNSIVCPTAKIAKCEKAVQNADTIIIVAGFSNHEEGEFLLNIAGSSIGGDRSSLRLADRDVNLIKSMKNTGKKIVVVFYAGSATIIEEWKNLADAIVYAGYPGMEGGNALVNLITGKVNFSGKLPFTIARDEKDYPDFVFSGKNPSINYDYYHGYCLFEKQNIAPAYPFGYGLSYTTFALDSLNVTRDENGILATVNVANAGSVAGREIVQLYVGSNIENKPIKLLKGFASVNLEAGEQKTCKIFVPSDKLKLYNADSCEFELPQNITVYVGDCSTNTIKQTI